MKYFLAIIACVVILVIYAGLCVAMKWQRFGGYVMMAFFFVAIATTWQTIIHWKTDKKPQETNPMLTQTELPLKSKEQEGSVPRPFAGFQDLPVFHDTTDEKVERKLIER